jgi:hypothetical protein
LTGVVGNDRLPGGDGGEQALSTKTGRGRNIPVLRRVELRSGSRAKLCLASAIAGSIALCLGLGWAAQVAAQGMALPGKFEVTPTGAASYTVPIAVPPGTAGMVPSLSIAYNSHARNGLLGMGWRLEGLPSIGRCPRTIAQDGVRGSVNYNADDRFCLDGQRLVAISGTYGADGTEYRTEIESFSKVVSRGVAGTEPAWFEVWTKSGQRMEFGNTTDSRVLAQGKPTARDWVVNKVSDTAGNYFTITYVNDTTNGQVYPSRIDYTGNIGAGLAPYNSVRFVYDTVRPDVVPTWHLGSLQKTTVRLTNVRTYTGSTMVADYLLTYEQSPITGRSRLTSLTLCTGGGACLPATTFAWQSGTVTPTVTTNVAGQDGTLLGLRPHVADFNGDGLADIMWNDPPSCWLGDPTGTGERALWMSTGAGNFAVDDTFLGLSGTLHQYTPFIIDSNRDGRSDVFWYATHCNGTAAGPTTRWLSTNSGAPTVSAGPAVDSGHWVSRNQFADFNGDARHDVLSQGSPINQPRSVAINITGPDGTFSKTALDACAAVSGNPDWDGCGLTPATVDINGDSLTDIVWITTASVSGKLVGLMLSKGDGTFIALPTVSDSSLHDFPAYYIDANADGNVDIAWDKTDSSGRSQGERRLWFGKGDGTFSEQANLGDHNGTLTGYQPHPADINGDGMADIVWVQTDTNGLSTGSRMLWLGRGDSTFTVIPNWGGLDGTVVGFQPVIADFNGDGKADILWDSRSGNSSLSNGTRVLWLSDGVAPDLMTSVTTGIGANAAITYKSLTDSSVYTKDSTATDPVIDLQGAMFVVSRADASNGVGGTVSTAYSYAGAKVHLDGRGLLGFRQVTVTDLQTNLVRATSYRQDFPFVGLVANETKAKVGAVTLNSTIHTHGATPLGGTRHQVFLSQSVVSSADLDGTPLPATTSTYQYDTYGNATQIIVSASDGHSKTTTNIYDNDTTKWFLGRLTRATVVSLAPGEGGSGSDDTTPDAFSFTDQTDVALNTLTTSNAVTITGIDAAAAVSVSGDGAPQIRIDGGSWTTSGTISNGQSLEARLTSASAKDTTRSAIVTVGGVSDTWSVTTTGCIGTLVAEGCLVSIVGEYTYTVPAGVTSIRVTLVGGGGGFGSRNHSSWHGYGGAGGGAAIKTLAVTPGQSFTLKVGPGGTSAPSDSGSWCNCSGSDGGASSFSNILSATGGQGGFRNGASQQALGGTGSGGDQNCNGGNGTQGTYESAVGLPGQCGGGAGGPSGAGGGASAIGGAGRSGVCGAGDGRGDSRHKGADGCVLIAPIN